MTRKTYRTAMGKVVDLGALQLQNENIRAVGNMKVNARGDLIDGWNKPIHKRPQQVQKQYDRQVTNVVDTDKVQTHQTDAKSTKTPKAPKSQPIETTESVSRAEPVIPSELRSDPEPVEASGAAGSTPIEAAQSNTGGLADAIARARRIQQQPLPTPRQLAQNQSGVKKI